MSVGLLIACSVLIVVVPLTAFFSTQDGYLDAIILRFLGIELNDSSRLTAAAILAVAAVNIILVVFACLAWAEDPPEVRALGTEKKRAKKDD